MAWHGTATDIATGCQLNAHKFVTRVTSRSRPLSCPARPRPAAGYNPLQAYGVPQLMPRVAGALGRLITACHTLYGFSRLTSAMK